MKIHYAKTRCGFKWGCAHIERYFSDEKRGLILIRIRTPKYKYDGILIYITNTGEVYIRSDKGEWK